jgi:polysaccharide biosynthesis/export protein
MRLHYSRLEVISLLVAAAMVTTGCNSLPTSGPSTRAIAPDPVSTAPVAPLDHIRIVEIDGANITRGLGPPTSARFSDEFPAVSSKGARIGRGDSLEISIWEAAPAALFGDLSATGGASRTTVLPEQVVDAEGNVLVPFVGKVSAAGKSLTELQAAIVGRLTGRANRPQVIVRLTHNASAYVTVIGDVKSTVRMPISPSGERLLDALAEAGGTTQPITKTTVQLARGTNVHSMPLEAIIRDPAQNVALLPGDVVTAVYQSLSFTVLGATGKNDEVNFEAQGISLAQALARSGGLIDNRADAQGVFVFRLEAVQSKDDAGIVTTNMVPTVYRLNLRDPQSLFASQEFRMQNRDILYVSNAPVAELQKFINLIYTSAFPVVNAVRAFD